MGYLLQIGRVAKSITSTLDSWTEGEELSEQALKDINSTMQELLKWTKFAGMQQLRSILEKNLKTDAEKLVYELSDGSLSTREIAERVGIGSKTTISGFWKRWKQIGVVQESKSHEGRFEHICSLGDVGITIPELPNASHATPSQDPFGAEQSEGEDQ